MNRNEKVFEMVIVSVNWKSSPLSLRQKLLILAISLEVWESYIQLWER